jgi:hypothetical protein
MSTAYDQLPEVIREQYTPEQWAWLSDAEKVRAMQGDLEPEA